MPINQFAALAMKNKAHLAFGEVGCYYCQETYEASKIKEWTDGGQTALCPKCNIDAVVSKSQHEISKKILNEAHNYWFGEKEDDKERKRS